MFDNRNKFNFVTICCCCWLSLLSLVTTINSVQALVIQQAHHKADIDLGIGERSGNALQQQQPDATVHTLNPRVDYNNEWRPVGRGDPLKNDPTYDYSPPALDRVRYWRADNESKNEAATKYQKEHAAAGVASGKKEVLLLGIPSERQRGQPMHSDTPMLQPKYTAIRRSYYAHQHQLPTHLMPPPMQTLAPPGHLMKSNAGSEYRHNMPSSSSSTTTTMAMMHSKPYYSTAATSPWVHTSGTSMATSSAVSMSSTPLQHHYMQQQQHNMQQHSMPYEHDPHHRQESVSHFTYSRPSMMSASFTPTNFIEPNQNAIKHSSTAPRKPWLHELLQKEVVKSPMKLTSHKYSQNYEHIPPSMGISTTLPPATYVSLSSTTSKPLISTTTNAYSTTSPVYFTTLTAATTPTTTTTAAPMLTTPITSISQRLHIPNTSNLPQRPTVAPMEMTTDALFKHYNQPDRPLLGPMYLIIEGHSKVKTYGKDELDPHRPKIVPIIPKREPVVRVADPNEKRGTLETFQVKHLHTKTTTPISVIKTTTTTAPKTIKTTAVPAATSTTAASTTTSTTTTVPSVATKLTTKYTNEAAALTPTDTAPTGMEGILSFLDSSLGSFFREEPPAPLLGEVSALKATKEPMIFVTTPKSATILHPVITTTTTKPPTPAAQQTQIEARIGTKVGSIDSLLDSDDELYDEIATTEPGLRDIRQVFDYDQLPESRLKDRMDVAIGATDDDADEADIGVIADDSDEDIDITDIGSLAAQDYEDENQQLIKRIDKLVNGEDADDDDEQVEFEELLSTEVDDDDNDDELELRHAKQA